MFKLMPLPFAPTALEPDISARTLEFHYGKHHQTYVDNLNKLIKETDFANNSLEEIVKLTAEQRDLAPIFNNAAQVYNHDFYWQSLKSGSGEAPTNIQELLAANFGSYEKFKKELLAATLAQFGSGWVWLVLEPTAGIIRILKTANADNPLAHNLKPLLAIDVWEHAYYLDYQNRRADYVAAIIEHLLNWDFFQKNLNI